MSNESPLNAASPEDLLGHLNEVERAHAPDLLYWRGRADLLRTSIRVAIVGSRDASPLALRRAQQLARNLVDAGVVVVSGLAKGIDSMAHRTAIEAGGSTIAVIGSPLDKVYPAEHAELQEEIAQRHLLVSQFPPGYPVTRSNFPRRNRVMALISHASVIVEAGETSGTLSQGWEAIRLGRPLFIMQSVAQNRALSWPKEMIRYGAAVLSEPSELLEVLPCGEGGVYAGSAF